MKIELFDTTLRDGAQARNVSFSFRDKLRTVHLLDELGIDYIEAGNPGSNPKDIEFFDALEKIELKNAKIVAFGSTRRKDITADKDDNLKKLADSFCDIITIFGKTWDFHVTDVIRTTLDENLKMIADSIQYLRENDKEVFFDAEHFFDGYKNNPEYALKCLKAALDAGATRLVLCETNGGCFPEEVAQITRAVKEAIPAALIGIHTHNDTGFGVANAHAALDNGAIHVQGVLNGFGERTGNCNLSNVIANLQIKKGIKVISDEQLKLLTPTCRQIAENANVHLDNGMPYVGKNAFAHKGGMHIDGVLKASSSFEHCSPELVGNERNIIISEVSGRGAIMKLLNKYDPSLDKDSELARNLIEKIKEMEQKGYQFENATASMELLIQKLLQKFNPSFDILYYEVRDVSTLGLDILCTIKVRINDQIRLVSAEGDGPVNALDKALRLVLEEFYPELKDVILTDYIVRVLDHNEATDATVRVTIVTSDKDDEWSTMGVSTNIIEASLIALVDSLEYKLLKKEHN